MPCKINCVKIFYEPRDDYITAIICSKGKVYWKAIDFVKILKYCRVKDLFKRYLFKNKFTRMSKISCGTKDPTYVVTYEEVCTLMTNMSWRKKFDFQFKDFFYDINCGLKRLEFTDGTRKSFLKKRLGCVVTKLTLLTDSETTITFPELVQIYCAASFRKEMTSREKSKPMDLEVQQETAEPLPPSPLSPPQQENGLSLTAIKKMARKKPMELEVPEFIIPPSQQQENGSPTAEKEMALKDPRDDYDIFDKESPLIIDEETNSTDPIKCLSNAQDNQRFQVEPVQTEPLCLVCKKNDKDLDNSKKPGPLCARNKSIVLNENFLYTIFVIDDKKNQ